MDDLTLRPIGVIRTPYTDRYRAPRQPGMAAEGREGVIELVAGLNMEQCVADLAGFDRIWVIVWFHRNERWKPRVLPPRGGRVKRSVLATRSPHRPNPLGLSVLRLLEVRGRTLRVADVDLLDGTPVLDIKPYIPYADAFPGSRAGWLDEVERDEAEGPPSTTRSVGRSSPPRRPRGSARRTAWSSETWRPRRWRETPRRIRTDASCATPTAG